MEFYVIMVTFQMTLLMNEFTKTVMMMDEFILWPKLYRLLLATCDEIMSWIIEIWMQNHLVSASNCNTVNL